MEDQQSNLTVSEASGREKQDDCTAAAVSNTLDGAITLQAAKPGRSKIKHTCLECGKEIVRENLKRHQQDMHSGVRPFNCPVKDCPRATRPYGRKDALQFHMKTIHGVERYAIPPQDSHLRAGDDGDQPAQPPTGQPQHAQSQLLQSQGTPAQPQLTLPQLAPPQPVEPKVAIPGISQVFQAMDPYPVQRRIDQEEALAKATAENAVLKLQLQAQAAYAVYLDRQLEETRRKLQDANLVVLHERARHAEEVRVMKAILAGNEGQAMDTE